MIVTLLTDFGTADYFVGAMKGAVLAVNPGAKLVDITHEIPAHDVEAGAFTLLAAQETFPAGTVHLAVVDPGVGSERRPVVVEAAGHLFVGPDNGIFGYIYERAGGCRAFHLTNRSYRRQSVSSTFHGRDVFAPAAGALSLGVRPEELGEEVTDFVRLPLAAPRRAADGSLEAAVIHVDHFGNLVTNLTPGDLAGARFDGDVRLLVGAQEVTTLRGFFAEERGEAGAPFAIWGSAGFLEVSVFRDSAARQLGVRRGQPVIVAWPGSKTPHPSAR
ncbi:MAG TPA: SAM-dependent chlorinase/fluorinase [Pyrinomonadaceae bacterium]|nr:SAM-dependent chlorinase/fluorinase [Pyrinomonadaceae bacterium]